MDVVRLWTTPSDQLNRLNDDEVTALWLTTKPTAEGTLLVLGGIILSVMIIITGYTVERWHGLILLAAMLVLVRLRCEMLSRKASRLTRQEKIEEVKLLRAIRSEPSPI